MLAWAIQFSSDRKPPASSLTCGLRVPVIYAQRARPSRARSCSRGGAPAYGGAHVGLSVRACRKSLCCYGDPSEPIANSEQISGDPREPAGNARRPRRARARLRGAFCIAYVHASPYSHGAFKCTVSRDQYFSSLTSAYIARPSCMPIARNRRARAAAARAAARLRGGICAGGSLFSREDSRRVAAGRLGPSAVADRISGGPRARGRRGSTAARARVCAAGSPW